MDPSAKMVPLSMFHAEYREGDLASLAHAWVQILPFLLFIAIVAIIAVTRQIHFISMALGVLATDLVCRILKKTLEHPRPANSPRDGFGMPSEHAAFVSYIACASIVGLMRMKVKPAILKPLLTVVLAALPVVVGWSRVDYRAHTIGQVLAGTGIGAGTALMWTYYESRVDMRRLQRHINQLVSFQLI